ncbi:unnamed protein product [Dicrocoelium dendriticum]|nr:unnamed protein product [Dicrocoelium dendriticum]
MHLHKMNFALQYGIEDLGCFFRLDATSGECEESCGIENYVYAGKWKSQFCFCGDKLPSQERPDNTCNAAHLVWVNAAKHYPRKISAPLEVVTDTVRLTKGNRTKLSIRPPREFNASLSYFIDFGDMVGLKERISDVTQPIAVQYTKVGPTLITVYANDAHGSVRASGGLALDIIDSLSDVDVDLDCPKFVVRDAVVECKVSVRHGNHLVGNVAFGTGMSEQFTVPDPDLNWMIPTARRLNSEFIPCPVADFVASGSRSQYSGILFEVSVHITALNPFEILVGAWITQTRKLKLSGKFNQLGDTEVELRLKNENTAEIVKHSQVRVVEELKVDGLETTVFERMTPALLQLHGIRGQPDAVTWTFGDGSPTRETKTSHIRHTYAKEGSFKVTVNISNPIGFFVSTSTVTVRSAFVFREIIAPEAEVFKPSVITLDLTASPFIICKWKVNGKPTHSGPEISHIITHATPMNATVSVTCENGLFTVTHSTTQLVRAKLAGLVLQSESLPVASLQSMNFSFTAGSDLKAQLTVAGQTKKTTVHYASRLIISEPMKEEMATVKPFILNVSNPLGSEVLSGTFRFDEPVKGMSVSFDPMIPKPSEEVRFLISFTQGTSIRLYINYSDFTTDQLQPSQRWPGTFTIRHKFTQAGVYAVHFEAASGMRKETVVVTVNVQGPLGVYRLVTTSTYVPCNSPYSVQLVRESGGAAVLAQLSIDWGDEEALYEDRFVEGQTIKHVYTKPGDFTLKSILLTRMENKSLTTEIKARLPIISFGCEFDVNPVKFGEASIISLDLRGGEGVTITAIFEPGKPVSIATPEPKRPLKLNHTYTKTGKHVLSVVAKNFVSHEMCILVADVRKPIKNMIFQFQRLAENNRGTVSALVEYSGTADEFPDDVTCLIDWGDGSVASESSVTLADLPLKISHVQTSLNYFNVTATLENGVSRYRQEDTIGVFHRMTVVKIEIVVASTEESGYGPQKDRFAAGNVLRITILSEGTERSNIAESNFDLRYTDGNYKMSLGWTKGSTILYTFNKPGSVKITAVARNPFSQLNAVKIVHITTDLRGLSAHLLDSTSLKPGEAGVVRVHFEAVSLSTCICVDKDDLDGAVVFPADGKTAHDCGPCPTFTPVLRRPINNIMDVNVKYNHSGLKNVTIIAKNPSDLLQENITITVTLQQCVTPEIKPAIYTMVSASSPLNFRSDEPVTVKTYAFGPECKHHAEHSLSWSLFEVDQDSLRRMRQVNISDLSSSTNLVLRIPANRLSPGFYEAKLRVAIRDSTSLPVFRQLRVFLISNYPPLMLQFLEGYPSVLDVGLDDEQLCLYPERYSFDPAVLDRRSPQGISNWTWYCGKQNEEFTEKYISPKPKGHTFPINRTGCFGDGPGRIKNGAGILCFWTGNLEASTLYKIRILAQKYDAESFIRFGSAILILNVRSGKTLSVIVKCTLPLQCKQMPLQISKRGAWAVAKTDDLYLLSESPDVSGPNSPAYKWQLKYTYHMSEGPFLNSSLMSVYTAGSSSATIRLNQRLFSDDLGATGCKICAAIELADRVGVSCLQLYFLTQPRTGKCEGHVHGSVVCANCTSFTTDFGPLEYVFYLNVRPKIIVGVSYESSLCMQLPWTENATELYVEVWDAYGNIAAKFIMLVQVPKPSGIESLHSVRKLLMEDNLELKTLKLMGNFSDKADKITRLAERLLIVQQLDTKGEFECATSQFVSFFAFNRTYYQWSNGFLHPRD